MPPRKCLTLQEKINLIKFAEKNRSVGSRGISEQFGIGKTAVNCILRKKEDYSRQWAANENTEKKATWETSGLR